MTYTRFALYCCALIVLSLLAIGLYLYLNLPLLVAKQANAYLREYGVQETKLGQIQVSGRHVHADRLWLRGEREGMNFEATLRAVQLNYDWRMLLQGQLQGVTVDKLVLTIEETTTAAQSSDPISIESLLPQPIIEQLPLQSLAIKQLQLDYHAPGIPPISVDGIVLLSERLQLQLEGSHLDSHISADIRTGARESPLTASLRLADGDTNIATLSAELQRAAPDEWRWLLAGELPYAAVLQWLRRVVPQTELALEVSNLQGLLVVGSSTVNVAVGHADTITISPEPGQSLLSQVHLTMELENRITQLDYPGAITGLAGSAQVSLELAAGQLLLTVMPTEVTGQIWAELLGLPPETQRWLRWDQTLPARWRNEEPLTLTCKENYACNLSVRDSLLALGNKDSELRWEALNLEAELQQQEHAILTTKLDARLKSRLRKQQLPQMELDFQQTGYLEEPAFKLALADTAESYNLDLQGTVNIKTGSGNYRLNARSMDLPYAVSSLLPIVQKFGWLQQTAELSAGSLALNSKLQSKTFDMASWQQQSQLSIRNLSGTYDEYRFDGMALTADWTGIKRWKTKQSVEFSLARFNMGFDVVDIQARLSLPKPTPIEQPLVNIEQFSAGMFGGRIYLAEPEQWDFGASSNKFKLRAEQWQLADMVALQQGQDIQAAGVLEGELPVTMTDGRMIIDKGYLRAMAPGGSIRYIPNESSKALAASAPELGLALDLLNDFQYQVLSSKVELDKEGNLLLGLSLTGKNPQQYEGRPVNFNINLEQNLDPLLQSLRLSDNLVEKIEGRLQ